MTPQVRLAASGELKEMSDIKISLKHPVRSVMELCLKLSTQNAVLPVLLALMIHSKEAEEDDQETGDYKLLQVISHLTTHSFLVRYCCMVSSMLKHFLVVYLQQ